MTMLFKKVLLVAPRFYSGKYRLAIHPLAGLGYIAESLVHSGIEVSVFDMNLRYSFRDLSRKISSFNPDIIGFTIMTFGHRDVYEIIRVIKKNHPNIKIAVGGPHLSMLQEGVLQECLEIDYGIILEGDCSFVELCQGKQVGTIQGLIYRNDGIVVKNEFLTFISELDKLPFPRYETFELKNYPTRQIGIVTSRGCPYDCIYCPVISAIGKQFRQRGAQSVVEEIGYWYRKGYREILILDDNFTLARKRTEEICDLLSKRNFRDISIKCPNGIRADRVDYELLKCMRESGFDMVAFGVEASENNILKNIHKGEDIETIEQGIRDACSLGFDVDLFFLIGSPGETLRDVESSFSLALRYPVRSAKFYNIVPFPTTQLHHWLAEHKYFLHPEEEILNRASHFVNTPCFYTPEMSEAERKKAFRMGQAVSRQVRRRFIERKLRAPRIIRQLLSRIYTESMIEELFVGNPILVRGKEFAKRALKSRIT